MRPITWIGMSSKPLTRNFSNTKMVLFHKTPNRQAEDSKSLSATNQRLLILSTPIKLQDGNTNMEQHTIPLRIDNGQLTITATEDDNKIVSLKRTIEPLPLALPLNQLNKKSPTLVKNEVGQVMGKLIPLGKFSNITCNSLSPINCAASSGSLATNFRHNVADFRGKKVPKLDEEFTKSFELDQKILSKYTPRLEAKNTPRTSSVIVPKVENVKKRAMTTANTEPKTRVHLVLGECTNIAGIGQTGTKIKPIPSANRKLDEKLNFLKVDNDLPISQPKIVNVRNCTLDEMNGSDDAHVGGVELDLNSEKNGFDIDNILGGDPLHVSRMLINETKTLAHSLKRDLGSKRASEMPGQYHGTPYADEIGRIPGYERFNSSKVVSSAKRNVNMELKSKDKPKLQSFLANKNNNSSKNIIVDLDYTEAVKENCKKLDSVINDVPEIVEKLPKLERIDVNQDDLYERFGIDKKNVTRTERALLSYIYSLEQKLSQSEKCRIQALVALQKDYSDNNNPSHIQKRFIESQLRNSARLQEKPRFIDLVVARDILHATGPRGYNNLRKLFSLPDMSTVGKTIFRT